jgi:uncharacterized membrane protein YtjA (UPF0391 family)
VRKFAARGGTLAAPRRYPAIDHLQQGARTMFGWAIMFLIVALIAAALGFGGVAGTAMSAAQIVFVVALIAFVVSAVVGYTRRA